jgi:hypothetical protein
MIETPEASRQVRFHQLLLSARKTWLTDALSEALRTVSAPAVKAEIATNVAPDVQAILAASGIRDEQVLPTTVLLRHRPTLVGYYRLLLGLPRKTFYRAGTGRSLFQSMEVTGRITPTQDRLLPDLVAAMVAALSDLVRQVSPAITPRDVAELPLLTLGSQLQGANNNVIGQEGTRAVFLAIRALVSAYLVADTDDVLVVQNAAGRTVRIALAADPDVTIVEELAGSAVDFKVAIEIKAGTDASNAYNRAGEAEKSHAAAKARGARDFWTIIARKGTDSDKLQGSSGTTTSWFDVSQIFLGAGPDWDDFRARVIGVVGIPNPPP